MNYHLAILSPVWLELILSGDKTIESRFTKVRCAPFGKVETGDSVYLKESGGPVKGMFRAAEVETFENLDRSDIQVIYRVSGRFTFGEFFTQFSSPPEKWLTAKHATLIHVSDPITFETPFAYHKRDPRAWVVLDAPLHICEICDDAYLLQVYETPDNEWAHGSEHLCPFCYAQEVSD